MNGNIAVIAILKTALDPVRVVPLVAEQGAPFPLVMVEANDLEPFDSKSGVASMDLDSISVYCEAKTAKQAIDLAKQSRAALDGNSGTFNTVEVEHIRFINQSDYTEKDADALVYGIEQTYQVRAKV